MGPSFALNHQNNAIIVSLMVPGTVFGKSKPSLYKNIFVDDRPQVLLSFKIFPPDCDLVSFDGGCPGPPVDLTQQSVLNLNIENLFTPFPIEKSSHPVRDSFGYPNSPSLPPVYTLTGSINIRLTNVFFPGKVVSNVDGVNISIASAHSRKTAVRIDWASIGTTMRVMLIICRARWEMGQIQLRI